MSLEDKLYHAIHINKDKCIACSHCVKVCPTEALHIWEGKSNLNPEKCIDCDECYRVCPVGAIEVEDDGLQQIEKYKHRAALIPSVFMGQFDRNIKATDVFKAVQKLGFQYVYEVEEAGQVLEKEFTQHINQIPNKPLISTFCPAVVRLIQLKFPDIVENFIPTKTPVDVTAISVRKKLSDIEDLGIFYFTPCSAKITSLKAPIGEDKSVLDGVININSVFNKVKQIINNDIEINSSNEHRGFISNNAIKPQHIRWSLTGGEALNLPGVCLSLDGTDNIISFLDRIETQGCSSIDFLEMKICDQGCAGGILTPQDRFLTAQKLKNRSKYYDEYYQNHPTSTYKNTCDNLGHEEILIDEIEERKIIEFDSNPIKAVEMMRQFAKVKRKLPDLDCSACGYKTCDSLARNVVKEKAQIEYCFVHQKVLEEKGDLKPEMSKNYLEKIWGEKKLNKRDQ
jgi:iron only hydrogenase large subunit-like protein